MPAFLSDPMGRFRLSASCVAPLPPGRKPDGMQVGNLLNHSASLLDGRPALVDDNRELTSSELDLMSSRLAAALAANGIRPGDRVPVFMDNRWEAIVAILAIIRAGADFTPVAPAVTGEALAAILNQSRATCLVTEARLVRATATAMAAAPGLRFIVIAGCEGSPGIDGILRFEDAVGSTAPGEAPSGAAIGSRDADSEIASTALGRSFCRFIAAARGGKTFVLDSDDFVNAAA
jgi:hypothetical protein